MANYQCYYMLLLLTFSEELSSGAEITQKYTCLGDTAYLFENITFENRYTVVSLYKNELLAMWIMQNSNLSEMINMTRVFLDNNLNIGIRTFRPLDQGKYTLTNEKGNLKKTYEVQVNSLVAPNRHCIPKITHHADDFFEASLEREEECGKPLVHVYWQNDHGISSFSKNHKTLVKLTHAKEPGTYYACVEGPAFKCAGNFTKSDYCSNITIEGDSCFPVPCSEPQDKKTVIGVSIAACVVIIIAVVIILLCKKRFRGGTRAFGRSGAPYIGRDREVMVKRVGKAKIKLRNSFLGFGKDSSWWYDSKPKASNSNRSHVCEERQHKICKSNPRGYYAALSRVNSKYSRFVLSYSPQRN